MKRLHLSSTTAHPLRDEAKQTAERQGSFVFRVIVCTSTCTDSPLIKACSMRSKAFIQNHKAPPPQPKQRNALNENGLCLGRILK